MLIKCFAASFTFASKLVFINLLNSVEIKLVVSIILFSTFVTFVFKAALVPRLIISSILFSISVAFRLRAVIVKNLVILGIFF